MNNNEFAGVSQDGLRQGALDELRGTGQVPQAPDEKQDKANALRLKHIMSLPSDKTSADDQAFLRADLKAWAQLNRG